MQSTLRKCFTKAFTASDDKLKQIKCIYKVPCSIDRQRHLLLLFQLVSFIISKVFPPLSTPFSTSMNSSGDAPSNVRTKISAFERGLNGSEFCDPAKSITQQTIPNRPFSNRRSTSSNVSLGMRSGNRFLSLGRVPSISSSITSPDLLAHHESSRSVQRHVRQDVVESNHQKEEYSICDESTIISAAVENIERPESLESCCGCHRPIINEDLLRATTGSEPYHLSCFRCAVRTFWKYSS